LGAAWPEGAEQALPLGQWVAACWHECCLMVSAHCPIFRSTLLAYGAGLLCTYVISYTFRAAQPALLYLVPFCLLAMLWSARREHVLAQLWAGDV
jgi:hypothetical protein